MESCHVISLARSVLLLLGETGRCARCAPEMCATQNVRQRCALDKMCARQNVRQRCAPEMCARQNVRKTKCAQDKMCARQNGR